MVSITSNKLVELNKDNLSKVIEEVISCQQIITDELVNDIEIYQELKNSKHKKQFAVKNLMRTLDTINQSIGWQAFIQLFNITKDDEENIFFTDVLPLLNKTHLPALPWGTAPKCWLIKEDSEDRIVHSTQQNVTIPNNEFLGNITPLIPFDAEVTKRIQTGVGRSRDIMLLYLNLCIFYVKIHIFFYSCMS